MSNYIFCFMIFLIILYFTILVYLTWVSISLVRVLRINHPEFYNEERNLIFIMNGILIVSLLTKFVYQIYFMIDGERFNKYMMRSGYEDSWGIIMFFATFYILTEVISNCSLLFTFMHGLTGYTKVILKKGE